MAEKIHLLRFHAGGLEWGLDPFLIESITTVSSKKNLTPVWDFAKKLDLSNHDAIYKKIILLKSQNGKENVGIFAIEVSDIEEVESYYLQPLPPLIQKKIQVDFILGCIAGNDSLCLLLDGEKLAELS